MWWKKQEPYPNYYQDYLKRFKPSYSRKAWLDEINFWVLDTETTGLSPLNDTILSIGMVLVNGYHLNVASAWECLIKPVAAPKKYVGKIGLRKPDSTKGSILIHGIRPMDTNRGISLEEALPILLNKLKNGIIIGHHIGFDITMLNRALEVHHCGKLRNIAFDTVSLARRVETPFYTSQIHPPKTYSLDALCEQYGIIMHDRHTALGDAYLTALLFLKLRTKLAKRGIKTLGQLQRSI